MDSLIETFHLDVKAIIAQLVNFAIVFSVLWFFALKPLTKMMRERTGKIEKGLLDAKKNEEKLIALEEDRKKVIADAKKQGLAVLEEASKKAEQERQEAIEKTKKEVAGIIQKGKEQLVSEKTKVVSETKAEIGNLIVAATDKLLGEALTKEMDEKLTHKIIKEYEKD